MTRLAGKVALVTGAGRGIGRAIALRLAEDGASLVINYCNSRASAEEVVTTIRALGRKAIALQADVSSRQEVVRMFQQIDSELGRIDIVVNSAGIANPTPLVELDEQLVEALLNVNLRGSLYVGSEAAKRLSDGGRIVNFGSSIAEYPIAGTSVYAATKAAAKAFTSVWAKELGAKGITVNTVIPGATSPGMMETAPPEYREYFAKGSPSGRIGRAEEVAAVVAFLCSPEASWTSGTHILVNGAANT